MNNRGAIHHYTKVVTKELAPCIIYKNQVENGVKILLHFLQLVHVMGSCG
jgi:hypothetical protein